MAAILLAVAAVAYLNFGNLFYLDTPTFFDRLIKILYSVLAVLSLLVHGHRIAPGLYPFLENHLGHGRIRPVEPNRQSHLSDTL